ncbi:hypothetical protein [Pectobacterium carotovorum]|uniref:hypothetical protein n=1 Tax=Pectobacterium carotovorum TaxID=554 RepID=UPI00137383DD|nr:hypothetical protein [Pectobacterium carotovorum]QHP57762.1 hypothetical protein EH204_07120 [Pectobacterium carotovorum subsp. carotovorum]
MSHKLNLSAYSNRKHKGQILARFDQERKMLESGSLGVQRLMMNIALDFMEKNPTMTWEQALAAAWGYCDRTHN